MTSVANLDLHTDHDASASAALDRVRASVLDADNTAIETFINTSLLPALARVIRDDDTLIDQIVRLRNLHPEVSALVASKAGWQPKADVQTASTANINLAAPGATIAGRTMSANDRFLAKNQTATAENGIYLWNGAATPATRAVDADTATELGYAFVTVQVGSGASLSGTSWVCNQSATDIVTLGTTSITFGQTAGTMASADMQPVVSALTRTLAATAFDFKSTGSTAARNLPDRFAEVVNVKDFGAVGDGATNDTDAFIAASEAVTAADGGTLVIPPGTYVVGKQTLAGAGGGLWAYEPSKIIWIENCTRPVRIIGHGASLKLASGMKFGAYHPVTGAAVGTSAANENRAWVTLGGMVAAISNRGVVIEGLELDGNSSALALGGQSDATGWQFGAYGVYVSGNEHVAIRDVYTHHHGLDGIGLVWTGEVDSGSPGRRFLLENVRSEYNSRQGCSWVGGVGMTAISCKFSHTGKGAFASGPGAGFDVEAESAVCRNGLWINCEMVHNNSQGLVADSGDSADLHLIGCTLHSADAYCFWNTKPRVTLTDCRLSGTALGNYTAAVDRDKTKFINCKFDSSLSFGYGVYGTELISASGNPIFDGCTFSAVTGTTVKIGSISSTSIVRNCSFIQNGSTGTSTLSAVFEGENAATFTTGTADLTGHVVKGRLALSGTIAGAARIGGEIPATIGPAWEIRAVGNNGSVVTDTRMFWSYAAPTTGAWVQGDICWNSTVGAGGVPGWICVTSGTPGTWKAMANVAA